MSGLVLRLAPHERYFVNGAVLENGDRPCRVRILDRDARVLRWSDAIKPEEVDTPVKQVYFAIQLLITGDLREDETLPAIFAECDSLAEVFNVVDAGLVPLLRSMIECGNYYSALRHLRQILELERQLMAASRDRLAGTKTASVA